MNVTGWHVLLLIVVILVAFGTGVLGTLAYQSDDRVIDAQIIDLDYRIMDKSRQTMDIQNKALKLTGDMITGLEANTMSPTDLAVAREQVRQYGDDAAALGTQISLLFAERQALLNSQEGQ